MNDDVLFELMRFYMIGSSLRTWENAMFLEQVLVIGFRALIINIKCFFTVHHVIIEYCELY